MTREEAIEFIKNIIGEESGRCIGKEGFYAELIGYHIGALEMAITALSQEPCDDAISRKAVCDILEDIRDCISVEGYWAILERLKKLPSVTQKSGKCKNCKYFEYDSVAKVDGIPLIVAHEICNKWGGGCRTKEDGYCHLFEPQESEDKE